MLVLQFTVWIESSGEAVALSWRVECERKVVSLYPLIVIDSGVKSTTTISIVAVFVGSAFEVAVIVVLPFFTPVTKPVDWPIVATFVSLLDQDTLVSSAFSTVACNCKVSPAITLVSVEVILIVTSFTSTGGCCSLLHAARVIPNVPIINEAQIIFPFFIIFPPYYFLKT